MYAIKLELKLNDRKRTLMALYSCSVSHATHKWYVSLISKKYTRIRRKDLQASCTIADRKLAAISDCGFSELRCQLVYKSSMYGTTVELVDRWYPSSKTCSNCGRVRSMPLKERVCECQHCSAIMNRDIQVAIDLARHQEARQAWQGHSVKPADKKEPAPLQKAVREH